MSVHRRQSTGITQFQGHEPPKICVLFICVDGLQDSQTEQPGQAGTAALG